MLNRIIILVLFVVYNINAFAQSSIALKKADVYFKDSSYYNAIINYEIYLGMREAPVNYSPYTNNKKKKILEFEEVDFNKPNALNVFYNLAQSYRMLNDYSAAQKWYNNVLLSRTTKFPLVRLYNSICLRALGHYNDAEKGLKKFVQDNADNKEMVDIANGELNNISYIRQQIETRRPPEYSLHKLKGNLDQVEGAYAPVIIDTTIYFTSARIVDTVNRNSKINMHVNHLFTNTLEANDVVTGKASIIKFPSRSSSNEGTPTISADGNSLYFTRWEAKNGKLNASIYYSKRKNDSIWSEPTKLDEHINKVGYNSIQPFITQDGKYLLFASDCPGGAGKYDIWAGVIDSAGHVSEPFNLQNINTKDDEKAPFYHSNTKTLVFSSDGRVGMGGFDLYSSNGELQSLSTPVNMGVPINSVKDDNYFYSASKDTLMKRAYVSSDRKSDCCFEIFSVQRLPKKIFTQKVDGLISDKITHKPIPNVTVIINNWGDSTKDKKIVAGTDGLFLLNLTDSMSGFTLRKKGYKDRFQPFRYNSDLYADTIHSVEFELEKLPRVKIKQYVDAIVTDCDTKKPISKAYITVINKFDTSKNFVLLSNKLGKFSCEVSDSINGLWFEKKAYFDKSVSMRINSENYESDTTYTVSYCMNSWKPVDNPKDLEDKPVEPIRDPIIVSKVVSTINKTDSTVIYFDFNKTDLKTEAVETLDKLLAILKTYPTISLELDISGHTDSKGSDEVNIRIGRGRALACLDYLIQKGISESRLKLKSYGKSVPVAPESINNKDNPDGRAKNRRVIMKVRAKVVAEEKK